MRTFQRIVWVAKAAALGGFAALMVGCATMGGASGDYGVTGEGTPARELARTRLELASGYYENGQYAVALGEARKAQAADPGFAESYNMSGLVYLALGDRAKAEADFKRTLSLDAGNANAHHNLGWLSCEKGDYADANQQFEAAMASPTYLDRSRTLMAQGVCQARAGDRPLAEKTLMHAYELDAGNPVIGYNLALLLFQRGDVERAKFYIQRLNNSELANAQSLWLGMKIAHRMGNDRTLQELGSQLRQRFPDSPEMALWQGERFDE